MRFARRVPGAPAVVVAIASGSLFLAACGGDDEPDVIAPAVAEPAVEVRVTSHEDGETVRRARVRLEGIVTPGAQVRVNGRRARRVRGGRDEPDKFVVRLTLRRGSNTIRVIATKEGSRSAERELVLVRRRGPSRRQDEERPQREAPQPVPQPAPGPGEGTPPPGQGGVPAPAPAPQGPGQGGPPAPAKPPSDQGGPPAPPPREPGQGGPPAPG